MPLTRASELLAITGFGLERYRKLEPFVTALPIGTSINLCTASPELLDALVAGRRQFTLARDDTMETRKQRCFPTKQDYESGLQSNEKTGAGAGQGHRPDQLVLPLDHLGHYWHYSVHAVQSPVSQRQQRSRAPYTKKPRNALSQTCRNS